MIDWSVFLSDESQQEAVAGRIAKLCTPGMVIFLQGDLGAGKTTMVRGFLKALGYSGIVKSPTYTLVEPYQINHQSIYHFDLYRLADPDELEYVGARDYFDNKAICLVEWPEKAEAYLPKADLHCQLSYEKTGRRLKIQPATAKGELIIQELT